MVRIKCYSIRSNLKLAFSVTKRPLRADAKSVSARRGWLYFVTFHRFPLFRNQIFVILGHISSIIGYGMRTSDMIVVKGIRRSYKHGIY